ncbi:MAG TPA: hypothetical protein VNL16_06225, partial [Chloroflexota bacterium]|nr:hypothetical protein [Chloroflexota bacterium]
MASESRRDVSPLLKELRLWERRARRGVVPPENLLPAWQRAVVAAQTEEPTQAGALATHLGRVLRAVALARLVSADQSIGRDRPLDEPVLSHKTLGRWQRDIDRAGDLGADVAGLRARLAFLLAAQLDARLLAAESRAPSDLDASLREVTGLWGNLIDAEQQAEAPGSLSPLSIRLAALQSRLEAPARASGATLHGALGFGSAASLVDARPAPGVARPNGPRAAIDHLHSMDRGATVRVGPAAFADRIIGADTAVLTAIAASSRFVQWQANLAGDFVSHLAGLAHAAFLPGAYGSLGMPLAIEAELQPDWFSGDPASRQHPAFLDGTRVTTDSPARRGARVDSVGRRPAPRSRDRSTEARPASASSPPDPRGSIVDRVRRLDGAMSVLPRSGSLLSSRRGTPGPDPSVVGSARAIAPASPARPPAALAGGRSSFQPRAIARPMLPSAAPLSSGTSRLATTRTTTAAPKVPAPATSRRPLPPMPPPAIQRAVASTVARRPTWRPARIEPPRSVLDVVAGDNLGHRAETEERAREVLPSLETGGLRGQLLRGRQVATQQDDAAQGQRAADLIARSPMESVAAGPLALFAGAMLVARHPGYLEGVVAPSSAARFRGSRLAPAGVRQGSGGERFALRI